MNVSQDTREMVAEIRRLVDTVDMPAADFCEFVRGVTFYRNGGMETAQAVELALEEVFTTEEAAKYRIAETAA